jgi:O-antigen/teichoic acid export membrane protein
LRDSKGASPDIPLSPEAAADVRTIAAGGGLQILGQVLQRALALVYTAVAVRVLGTAGYGVYRQVAQVLSVGGIFGVAGFEYAVVREVAAAKAAGDHGRVRGSVRTALRGATAASLLVTGALLLLAPRLAAAFAESDADADTFAFLIRVGSPFVILFSLTQVLRFSTHPYRTMIPSVVAGHVVRPVTRFVLGVAALAAGFAVTGAVVSLVLSAAAGLLAAAWYARRIPTDAERVAAPTSRTGPLVRFAVLQGAAGMLSIQTLGLGIIILGLYRSDSEVGLYGVALSLLTPVNILFTGLSPIWAPIVTELYEQRAIERLGSLFQTVNRWLSTFGLPVLAALALQPDVFLRVLAGSPGSEAESALVVLAAGHFFYIGTGPTSFILSMTGHPGINLGYSFMQVSLFIFLGVLVVPDHGLMGMAWVSAVVTLVGNVARLLHVWILVGIQPFGRTFFKPVVATLVAAVPMIAANYVDGVAVDAVSIGVAAVLFLLTLRLLGIDPQEAHVFEQLKRRARALRMGSR